MLSEILPSTPLSFNISREPSLDLGFRDLDRTLSESKFQQPPIMSEKDHQTSNNGPESENKFFSSTTMGLLRNYSSDSPLLKLNFDAQCNLDHDLFSGWNPDQDDFFGMPMDSLVQQQSGLGSMKSQMLIEDEEKKSIGQIGQLFDKLEQVPSFPSTFQFDQKSDLTQEDRVEENCTGKGNPFENLGASELLNKIGKIQRKTIKKKPQQKDKLVSAPKKEKSKVQKVALSTKKIIPKRESKNIVKNYGKAMAAFSISEIAVPYLYPILHTHRVTMEEYKSFIINNKEKIDGIGTLRKMLTADLMEDSPQTYKLKCVFREISEVFARDFAVNWIFSSRSQYKSALLEFRFKMLRRVREPWSFTFLKPQ